MADVRDFTLHHTVSRPISVHFHGPVAKVLQHTGLIGSAAFTGVTASLMYLAYTVLIGASLGILLAVILPLKAAILLLGFFVYYKRTFKRELRVLEKKYHPKWLHI